MKRTLSLLLSIVMLLACVPAHALRPVSQGGDPIGSPGEHAPALTDKPQRPGVGISLYNPDSDYDGVPDYADAEPKSNSFASTMYHTRPSMSIDVSYSVDHVWDYSWLMQDNTVFNEGLCRLSSIIAGMGYHMSAEDADGATDEMFRITNSLGSQMDLISFMRVHGMTAAEFNLNSYCNDSHLTLADVGVHSVIYGGKAYEVVLIALRGSNATWQEWNSNFEIGHNRSYYDPDFAAQKFGVHPDWTDAENHMGFDIAANRVLALANGFVAENGFDNEGVVYWVTGHSRGAAIANIIASKLIDGGEKVFSYNFACPGSTTASDADSYEGIFNVVNEDDMVTYLPFEEWGFTRYGKTARLDMDSGMQAQWKSMMGESYDHAETTLTNALDKLMAIASDRDDAYRYTCSCHGDGTDDSIMTSNWYFTNSNREKAIAKTPACLAGYYKLELEDATFYWTYHCQPPIFFMQYLACYLSDGMTTLEFADYDVADKYESAKWALATAAAMGVGHPHYCESYFIIANTVTAWDFD